MGTEGVALAVFLAYFLSSSDVVGALGNFLLLHYFQNCEIKNTGLMLFYVRAILTGLLLGMYVDAT